MIILSQDIVVNANPNTVPFSLLFLHKLLREYYGGGVRLQTHVHSSINEPLSEYLNIFNQLDQTSPVRTLVQITLIWKDSKGYIQGVQIIKWNARPKIWNFFPWKQENIQILGRAYHLIIGTLGTGCPIKKANFPPNLTFEIRRAPNVKFGGKFAFLIAHPVELTLKYLWRNCNKLEYKWLPIDVGGNQKQELAAISFLARSSWTWWLEVPCFRQY